MESVSRRRFLRMSALAVGGTAIYAALPTALWLRRDAHAADESAVPGGYQPEMHQWAMAIDIEKCIGCRRCLRACKEENHVPEDEGLNRTWLERYEMGPDGSLEAELITRTDLADDVGVGDGDRGFFVPKLCNQCSNPPCVSVCPVNATFTTPDGVILLDRDRCIGCKYCVVACPYGARFLHPETLVVDKCTFCYHRITRGLKTACVQACPTGARILGDLKDPEDPVRQRLLDEALQVVKPSLGTKPRVYYKGLREGVR
jgi:Fe-S-cluster-containing dehydrogenase component